MTSTPSKLDRVVDWIDRDNARQDEVLKNRPAWWHIVKILFGLACAARSVFIALHAAGPASYAHALVFLVGGIYFVYEGVKMLRTRRM